MSQDLNNNKKRSRLNWVIGVFISILGAGGGIIAFLEYNDSLVNKNNKDYEKEMVAWENFSPESLSLGVQSHNMVTNAPFDLEKGSITTGVANRASDIVFRCWPQSNESLKVIKGVLWSDPGVMDFDKIKYKTIRDAKFVSAKHPENRPNVLFSGHRINSLSIGHVFFIKTIDGNVAKIQIIGYLTHANPRACREIKIKYEVFPVVKDPPKPKR